MARTARDPIRASFLVALDEVNKAKEARTAFAAKDGIHEEFCRHIYQVARSQGVSLARATLYSADHGKAQNFFRPEPFAEMRKPFQDRIEHEYKRLTEVLRCREELCSKAAQPFVLTKGGQWHLFTETRPGTYGSQTQPVHYAKARAEVYQTEVTQLYGVETEVKVVGREPAWQGGIVHAVDRYEVWVYLAEQVDVEALRRKPGLPSKQWAELCWKHGANPRVFNPYLPWHV